MQDTVTHARILLAEDDQPAREILVELLATLGHTVVAEVGTGRDAAAQAEMLTPDVVLLDIHMPDGSGLEAAQRITAHDPGIAVILFSGDVALSLSDQDVMTTNAIAYLPKPTPPAALDSTIRLAVARARALREAREDAVGAKQKLEDRKVIERAKGILMRRTGSSEQEAYSILRRTSQDRSVPMTDIANAVLESEPGFRAPTA